MGLRTIRHLWSSRTKKNISLPKRLEFLRKAKFVALLQRIEGGSTQWTIELNPADGKKFFLAQSIKSDLELKLEKSNAKLEKSNARICELQTELFEARNLQAATDRANEQLRLNIENMSLNGKEPAKGASVLNKFPERSAKFNPKPYSGSAYSRK